MLRLLGPLAVTGSRVNRWGEHVSSRHCPLWRYRSWHRPRQHGIWCASLLHLRRLHSFGYPFSPNARVPPWPLPWMPPLCDQPSPFPCPRRCVMPWRISKTQQSLLAALWWWWWCGVDEARCLTDLAGGYPQQCRPRDLARHMLGTTAGMERASRPVGTCGGRRRVWVTWRA